MNIASRLRLCALPLAVSLALSACSGSSTPSDGHKTAEPPARNSCCETALPAGWQRLAGAEMPAVHEQRAVLPAKCIPMTVLTLKCPTPAGSLPVVTTSSR